MTLKSKNRNFPNINPADTRRPEDIPLWSYFGRDVLDLNMIEIGRIGFLTNFDSAVSSDIHLASGITENFF